MLEGRTRQLSRFGGPMRSPFASLEILSRSSHCRQSPLTSGAQYFRRNEAIQVEMRVIRPKV